MWRLEEKYLKFKMEPMPELKKPDGHGGGLFRSPPPQLHFRICYIICHQDFSISDEEGGVITRFRHEDVQPVTAEFRTNTGLFNNPRLLFYQFSRLGIDSDFQQDLVSEVIRQARIYTSSVPKEELKVMRFGLAIVLEKFHYFDEDELLLGSVEMESMVEYEDRNYGMVPAARGSLRILKSVKLNEEEEEEDKSCSVCLEELVDIASRMPCAHLFHEDCILKWLQTSHVCPVCRFQMPVD